MKYSSLMMLLPLTVGPSEVTSIQSIFKHNFKYWYDKIKTVKPHRMQSKNNMLYELFK